MYIQFTMQKMGATKINKIANIFRKDIDLCKKGILCNLCERKDTHMRGVKYQITLKGDIAERLERLAKEKGLSRGGAIALAISELTDKEKKEK